MLIVDLLNAEESDTIFSLRKRGLVCLHWKQTDRMMMKGG
jgi:hypothetical protein